MSRAFLSDNAAPVHPKVWDAMRAADASDAPYDGDALSRQLDERFSDLFGRPAWGLWAVTGTAANCLALATMVPPHGGVVCHREAHIEVDECGAPGFFTHGAKLMLAEGEGAKLNPHAVERVVAPIRDDTHQIQPHALSLTQASEYGRAYTPGEIAALVEHARGRGFGIHVDGARFANAVAYLGCSPAAACGEVDALSFGCIKNGGMGADAVVFFSEAAADLAKYRRKRRHRDISLFGTHPSPESRMADLRISAADVMRPGVAYDPRHAAYVAATAKIRPTLLDDQVKLNDPGASQYIINNLAKDGWNGLLRHHEAEIYRLRNRTGDDVRAGQGYAAAVLYPDAPADAWRWHGILLMKAGRREEARAALGRYLAMVPNAPDAAFVRQMLIG